MIHVLAIEFEGSGAWCRVDNLSFPEQEATDWPHEMTLEAKRSCWDRALAFDDEDTKHLLLCDWYRDRDLFLRGFKAPIDKETEDFLCQKLSV